MDLPYTKTGRLSDVMALIQVLALDMHSHRSEQGLNSGLQGVPKSEDSWINIAKQHPEFFRVLADGQNSISLVARHVQRKQQDGLRDVLNADFVGKLIQAAIELHDREMARKYQWRAYIPLVVAITAGTFTLFGVVLKSWIGS